MNLSGLLPLIENLAAFKQLIRKLREQPTIPADVIESARAPLIVALARVMNVPILVVTARADRAKQLVEEIGMWANEGASISLFAEPDPLFYERMSWSAETIAARLNAMATLAEPRAPIIV